MKIRDLRQYIKSFCGTDSFEKLGTGKEEFFKLLNGHGYEDRFDAHIGSIASFATNSEEQLFYEFVQNAYDADASALMFYINESYLVVLNNGIPFYTDYDIEKRHGQLYGFLKKGDSDKYNDPTQKGAFGLGSKLLYTLTVDRSLSSARDLLLNAIKKAYTFIMTSDIDDVVDSLRPSFNTSSDESIKASIDVVVVLP